MLILDLIEFEKITIECLQHKYRYFVLDSPTISDYDYDRLTEKRRELGLSIGREVHSNWVGFDKDHALSKKALEDLNEVKKRKKARKR